MILNDNSPESGIEIKKGFIDSNYAARLNLIITKFLDEVDRKPFKFNYFHLDSRFCKLLNNEWLYETCKKHLGTGFRLDNAYGIQKPGYLMGDGEFVEVSRNVLVDHARSYNLLQGASDQLVFLLFLTDQKSNQGGFFHVPQSHNTTSNDLTSTSIFDFSAGDAILFPRNLLHGFTGIPMGVNFRYICMTFTPRHMCWRPYHEISHFGAMAETQREKTLLRPPYVESVIDNRQYVVKSIPRD